MRVLPGKAIETALRVAAIVIFVFGLASTLAQAIFVTGFAGLAGGGMFAAIGFLATLSSLAQTVLWPLVLLGIAQGLEYLRHLAAGSRKP